MEPGSRKKQDIVHEVFCSLCPYFESVLEERTGGTHVETCSVGVM